MVMSVTQVIHKLEEMVLRWKIPSSVSLNNPDKQTLITLLRKKKISDLLSVLKYEALGGNVETKVVSWDTLTGQTAKSSTAHRNHDMLTIPCKRDAVYLTEPTP